jgi:hypothetical protein
MRMWARKLGLKGKDLIILEKLGIVAGIRTVFK